MPLLWKLFAGNAAVLVVATLVLLLTPATISFPVALWELAVLVPGLAAMLAIVGMVMDVRWNHGPSPLIIKPRLEGREETQNETLVTEAIAATRSRDSPA